VLSGEGFELGEMGENLLGIFVGENRFVDRFALRESVGRMTNSWNPDSNTFRRSQYRRNFRKVDKQLLTDDFDPNCGFARRKSWNRSMCDGCTSSRSSISLSRQNAWKCFRRDLYELTVLV